MFLVHNIKANRESPSSYIRQSGQALLPSETMDIVFKHQVSIWFWDFSCLCPCHRKVPLLINIAGNLPVPKFNYTLWRLRIRRVFTLSLSLSLSLSLYDSVVCCLVVGDLNAVFSQYKVWSYSVFRRSLYLWKYSQMWLYKKREGVVKLYHTYLCVYMYVCMYVYIYIYRCPRTNVPDFGRVFLILKYTDITQNTYIQSWTVTEIIAREKWGLLVVPNTANCTADTSRDNASGLDSGMQYSLCLRDALRSQPCYVTAGHSHV